MATESGGDEASRWGDRLERPVDALPLLAFRVGWALLLAASTVRFAAHGWIDELYLAPSFHFSYLGFSWLKPPDAPWIQLIFAGLFVSAVLLASGVVHRLSALTFFLLFTAVELFDKTLYLNHYYFVSWLTFLMIWLPLGKLRGQQVASWVVWALRLQVGLVYFFAGVAKLQGDWLLRAEPLATWLPARAELPLVGPLLAAPSTAYAASWFGAVFDLSIPFLLLAARTRPWAWLAAVAFHGSTALLFEIGVFPWLMICSTIVFFSAEEIRAATTRVRGVRFLLTPCHGRGSGVRTATRCVRLLIAGLLALQLALPLRHLLYPGNVLWTEEGYRHSWRVMLVEKNGSVVFRVTPHGQPERNAYPSSWLTPLQEHQMAFQPDMILEFAHHLASEHGPGTQVRADALVSLNGRPSQRLIDPQVDLALQRRGLSPKRWILPLREGEASTPTATLVRRMP